MVALCIGMGVNGVIPECSVWHPKSGPVLSNDKVNY